MLVIAWEGLNYVKILLTGGAGYIGSHSYLELLEAGHEVAIIDNFNNSSPVVIERLEKLSQRPVKVFFGDVCTPTDIAHALDDFEPECVVHLAGLKSVSESVKKPIEYYSVNLVGTHVLLSEMEKRQIRKIIFSSSAVVYGAPVHLPITVEHPLNPINPYGTTKLAAEQLIRDVVGTNSDWSAVLLRYFNPVGAHQSGDIGESPNDVPNNLLPYVAQVAVGQQPHLNVFGADFDTEDGTGVRDYIHVMDLANGHVAALKGLKPGVVNTYNLGTGAGYSVLEVVSAFSDASEQPVPYVVQSRRVGDVAACYSDPSKAKDELGWSASHTLEDMCRDSWRWQSKNPMGYTDESKEGKNSLVNTTVISDGSEKHFFLAKGYKYFTDVPPFDDTPNRDEWQDEVYKFAQDVAMKSGASKVLDVGTGSGFKLMKYFSEFETTGVEVGKTLEFLKEEFNENNWISVESCADGYPDADLCICSDVIEHMKNPSEFLFKLSESNIDQMVISTPAREVLSADGRRPLYGPPGNKFHYFEWTMGEFNKLLSKYFVVKEHFLMYNGFYSQIALVEKRP